MKGGNRIHFRFHIMEARRGGHLSGGASGGTSGGSRMEARGGAHSSGGSSGGTSGGRDQRSELSDKISDLRSKASRLQSEALFSDESREISALDKNLEDALRKLETLKGKGYLHGRTVEENLKRAKELWQDRRREAENELRNLSNDLRYKSEQVDKEVRDLRNTFERDFREAERRYRDVENRVEEFERLVNSAESRIEGKFQDLKNDLNKASSLLTEIENGYNLLEKASFKLHQEEDLIYVCGAQYLEDKKKNGPKGNIFLTGNRFIFEQNEEVVVSRSFIFFTKKEHVQKIITERAIGALGEMKDLEQGFVFKAEVLDVVFKDGKAPQSMMFKLNKDSKMLKDLINRIISGDIERDKTGGKPPTGTLSQGETTIAPATEPAAAPSGSLKEIRCPGCGVLYDKPLLKGMTSDNCDYCGTTIRF